MNTTSTHLGALKVSGKDAAAFLQGQLTCDIHKIMPATHQLGAFCNRQGRVLALMDVFCMQEDYFLTLPLDLIETIQRTLEKFIVASKVKIENISEDYQLILSNDFLLNQMRARIPFIAAAQTELFLPHPLGLVDLFVVSFTKGCFVGQEIIARMQHRTQIKKSLQYFEIERDAMPNVGENIMLDDERTAVLVNSLSLAPQHYAVLAIVEHSS